jgi:hypothetical protein
VATTGNTTTSNLSDSLPTIIASARIVREYEGTMTSDSVVDKVTLDENTGTIWNEVRLDKLTAQGVSETTMLDNPQQMSDSLLSLTPTVAGIQTIVTDRVYRRLSSNVLAQIGVLGQNALQRKKDKDGLTQLDSFSTALCGAGATLTVGHVSAGQSRIFGNTTEPAPPGNVSVVLHPFQLKDIQDQLTVGITTTASNGAGSIDGMTAEMVRNGFSGQLFNANVFTDGNITIDSSDDAKGAIFHQMAIILVEGHAPKAENRRRPDIGGGAEEIFLYDEFIFGERRDEWGYELYSDATAPTS